MIMICLSRWWCSCYACDWCNHNTAVLHLQRARRSAGPQRTRPVHTELMHREFRKPVGSPDVSHRTHPERPVLTALKHREDCKTPSHRTLTTDALRACSVLNPSWVKHTGLWGQRPVPQQSASDACDFSKFPIGAIENIPLIFSKAPFGNVLTPTSLEMC